MKDIVFNLIYKINIPENDLFRIAALFLCSFIIVFLILLLIKGIGETVGDGDSVIGLGVVIILIAAFFGVSGFFIIKYIENTYEYIFIAIGVITALFNLNEDNIKKTLLVALIFFIILLYASFFNAPPTINDANIINQTNNYTNDLKSTLFIQKDIIEAILGHSNILTMVLFGEITLKKAIIIVLNLILLIIIVAYVFKKIRKRK
ncbi:hypothetical protein [Brachyspira sp. SAP_772]|uniref:hypothetical protein n=1 Tax=Brachyspira sp. SAP_772 TaxID=2608385 RepID=UPI0012F4DE55|nr:hypothetical protein [Brachyspira sp. SAP_772]